MNAHKPTFKPSPAQRPLFQRLTPLAWVFIGVVSLAALLGIAGCVMTLSDRPTDEPWDPTATPTPAPTETPMPTAGPSPTPTLWYQDIVTPTVAATEEVTGTDSIWWSDQMTEDDEGNLLPPQEVQDAVWEAFIAGLGCYNIADRETIPDASLDELTQRALLHLSRHPGVLGGVCNGVSSAEDLVERRVELLPIVRLVEFGPRNRVTCNISPSRCATAVSLEAQGAIWWHEDTCIPRGHETPCLLRLSEGEMVDHAPNQFYYAELEYDPRSEGWRIVYVEVTRF